MENKKESYFLKCPCPSVLRGQGRFSNNVLSKKKIEYRILFLDVGFNSDSSEDGRLFSPSVFCGTGCLVQSLV